MFSSVWSDTTSGAMPLIAKCRSRNSIQLVQHEISRISCSTGELRTDSHAWEQRQLGEVAEKVTEKNSGLPYQQVLTNSATHGIVRQSEYFDRIVAGKNHLDAYYVVNPNDYVYNPRISKEAPCGPINRNTLELTGIASPLYLVFRVFLLIGPHGASLEMRGL